MQSSMCVMMFQSNWLHTWRVEIKGSERLHSVGCQGWGEGWNAHTSVVCDLMEGETGLSLNCWDCGSPHFMHVTVRKVHNFMAP
jgi:hypothetical protein